jgi:hypothetical protein
LLFDGYSGKLKIAESEEKYNFRTRRQHMRKEASLEQWKVLYEAATCIKELKPWEMFWDMDLIAIRNGAEEDTVFFSILGRAETVMESLSMRVMKG